ncbi:S-methyl-5'-thioadenosine phosphorylase [bacterium]|nr:S-methyl-5'-thioadenosine phosphorylase [bacterium]
MIGFIGGSGLYSLEGLEEVQEKEIPTPFGSPSGPVVLGKIKGNPVAFLARHGQKHQFLPSEINFRANIWALKKAGVRHIVSVSAVGSLSEEIAPGDLAVVGQYIDCTRGKRESTFFGKGVIAHVSMAVPVCQELSKILFEVAQKKTKRVHFGKTYACVEGPRFGTRAESHFLRASKAQLVGMTNVPEAFLAREAQMGYAALGVVTDYDCRMEDEGSHVSAAQMLELYRNNLKTVQNILLDLFLPASVKDCACRSSLKGGLLSDPKALSPETRNWLEVLIH